MRIGCLQFAPVKGEINHNFSRADSVLLKSNPDDLDLLVLPELAFTGHGFQSLNDIYPFLEPSGSGITSLWARTTALKYDCSVVVGYAEKVDVRPKWPSDLEYYNSAICVSPDGETVANYRKCHLQPSDETWALEGPEGFHCDWLSGVGLVSLGLSMDINPYQFQEPWDKFDFAFHVLEVEANVAVVTMAWPTAEDSREFTRNPNDPDTTALMYWISRLEPIIRKENDDEIIVIFCNRCGTEGSTTYAGSSTVLGISNGEVRVYGLLGRGTKELLVVDTNNPPFGRLVYQPNADIIPQREAQARAFMEQQSHRSHRHATSPDNTNNDILANSQEISDPQRPPSQAKRTVAAGSVKGSKASSAKGAGSNLSVKTKRVGAVSLAQVTPNILTPSAPSPTPHGIRPRLTIPPVESITQRYIDSQQEHSTNGYRHIATPIPQDEDESYKQDLHLPTVVDGQHHIHVSSPTTTASKTNNPPAAYWRFENAFANGNQGYERPCSPGSEGTAFSDWFESDFASQASVDGSIRVKSGTNTARGYLMGNGNTALNPPYSINDSSRRRQRLSSPRPSNSSTLARDGKSESRRAHNRRDRSISAPEDYYINHNGAPVDPYPDNSLERQLAKVSRNIVPMTDSPGMKSVNSSGLLANMHRKRSNSALVAMAQSHAHGNSTPASSQELRGRRSSRHLNGEIGGSRLKNTGKSQSTARKGNRSASRPVDLSQFKLIEEYPSPNCPVHGIGTGHHDGGHRSSSQNKARAYSGRNSRSRSIGNRQEGNMSGSKFQVERRIERPSSAGMITHSDKDLNGYRSPISRMMQAHPLKLDISTPSLTAPFLERHQSPAAPWVETWMPPLSKSVPPGALNDIATGTTGMISPPPESGRTTPRAMILFKEKGNEGGSTEQSRSLKCIDRSVSAMELHHLQAQAT